MDSVSTTIMKKGSDLHWRDLLDRDTVCLSYIKIINIYGKNASLFYPFVYSQKSINDSLPIKLIQIM